MKPRLLSDAQTDLLTPGNVRDIIDPLFKLCGRNPKKTLDIGSNTTWLARFVEDYWGLEVSQGLVDFSRAYWQGKNRWSAQETESRIRLGTGHSLPYEDASFDTVVMRDVLEHVADPLKFYGEAVRVLKPGGLLLVSCPDAQKHVWNEPTHLRPFPLAAQEYLAAHFGLNVLAKSYESVAPGTQKLARLFAKRTPLPIRWFWILWFWPRNAVTIARKTNQLVGS